MLLQTFEQSCWRRKRPGQENTPKEFRISGVTCDNYCVSVQIASILLSVQEILQSKERAARKKSKKHQLKKLAHEPPENGAP
jgi:hypothetical protein